jgi:hypothetical protein
VLQDCNNGYSPIRVYSFIMSYLVIFDGTTAFVGDASDVSDSDHKIVGRFSNENEAYAFEETYNDEATNYGRY